jgi:hypothetical protein
MAWNPRALLSGAVGAVRTATSAVANTAKRAVRTVVAVADVTAYAARNTIVNRKEKRVASTQQLEEVLDAGFSLAAAVRQATSAESPGGTRVTLNELLTSVTDDEVRGAIRDLVERIDELASGKGDLIALISAAASALVEFLATLKVALAGGRVTPAELLEGITQGRVRPELQKALDRIWEIPLELQTLDFGGVMRIAQIALTKLPALTGKK